MLIFICSYCPKSYPSQIQLVEHELTCGKNPKNVSMTNEHFKKRMELKKRRGIK